MKPFYKDDWLEVWHGDCRAVMAEMEPESVHCVVTSPPYWGLRDYGTATWAGGDAACDHEPPAEWLHHNFNANSTIGNASTQSAAAKTRYYRADGSCPRCGATRIDAQLGLEPTPEEYVANLVAVFREVRRVLRKDGTVWLNLGDSYAASANTGGTASIQGSPKRVGAMNGHTRAIPSGLKPKDLVGIPWRVAFALQADGWYLRSEIIWSKPNPMPESVTDRPTKSHEQLFLLSKSPRYYFDNDAVREGVYDVPGDAAGDSVPRAAEPTRRVVSMPTMFGGSDDGLESSPRINRDDSRSQPALRRDGERQGDEAQAGYIRPEASTGGGLSADASGPRSQPTREHESLWASSSGSVLRSPEDGNGAAVHAHGGAMVGDPSHAIGDVRVLRTDHEADDGSRDPVEQGWGAHDGERGGSLQALQQSKARPTGAAGRNLRSVWTVATAPYPGAHFATFPPKLIEPCIKAGTSERGVCPECGAPWERAVERGDAIRVRQGSDTSAAASVESATGRHGANSIFRTGTKYESVTTGWHPSCAHISPLPPRPAVVLDCFAGSGTTGLVAQSLSRRAVLIDLSLDYLGQLMDRNADIPLGLGA